MINDVSAHAHNPQSGSDMESQNMDNDSALKSAVSSLDKLQVHALLEAERIAEALIFASAEPVNEKILAQKLPEDSDINAIMERLSEFYAARGVNLLKVDDCWAFRTAADLSYLVHENQVELKRLSRAALEVLSIIAYHQPVTRADIEEIRGVSTSKGTLDVLMESEWVKIRGRRRTPGRPVTYGTTLAFLDHFGLSELRDLPGLEELKGSGLLSGKIPSSFQVPLPLGDGDLMDDEDPLDAADIEEFGILMPKGD